MLSSLASVLFFSSPLFCFISPPSEAHFLPIAGWCLQSSIRDPCLHCKRASGPTGSISSHSSPELRTAKFPHLCVLLTRQTQYSLSWSHCTHLPGSLLHSSLWLTGCLPWQQGAWECVSKAFSHIHKLDFASFFLPIDATSATTSSNPHLLVGEHL